VLLGVGLGFPLYAATVFVNFTQGILQFTPTLAGELLAIRVLTIVVCAPISALLNSFAIVNTRILIATGFLCTAASYAALGVGATTGSDFRTFIGPILLSGVGFAGIFSPLVFSTVAAVGQAQSKSTTAFLRLAFVLGGSIGNAALGVIMDHREAQHWSDLAGSIVLSRPVVTEYVLAHSGGVHTLAGMVNAQATTLAFADAAYVTALVTLLFLPLVLFVPVSRRDDEKRAGRT
jgi:DHA2 family multidrug resistance protein